MRLMVKLTVGLLALALLLQGALWYATSRWLAQTAQRLEPIATLHYGGSVAWLTGTTGARDVSLRPHATPGQEITAERVELRLGSPLALANFILGRGNEMPDNASLAIRRMRLSAGLEQGLREQASRMGYLAPFEALGCNSQGRFSGADYAELGWLDTGSDVDVTFAQDDWRERTVSVDYDMRPMGRFQFVFTLDNGASLTSANSGRFPIKQGRIRFHDHGMIASRNAYCARSNDLAEAAFVERHMEAVEAELEAFGMFLDAAVLDTYRQFASQGGQLELDIAPTPNIAFAEYHHYAPDDQLRMLNARLRHDEGTPVQVTANFHSDSEIADVPSADSPVRVVANAADVDAAALERLPELVGHRVMVRTGDVSYVGELLSVDDERVWIANSQFGPTRRTLVRRDQVTAVRLMN